MTVQIQTAQVVLALPGGNWGRVVYLIILAALASLYADTQPTFHSPFKPPSQISFLSRPRLNPSPPTPLPPSPTLPSPAQFIQDGSSCTLFRLAVPFVMGASLLVVLWLVPHITYRLRISCSRTWRLCLQTPISSSGSAPDPEVVPLVGQCPLIASPPSPEPPDDPPPNPSHSASARALAPVPQSHLAPSPSWMDPEDEQPPPPPPPDDGAESAASLPHQSPRTSWLWWMVIINILLTISGILYGLLGSIVTIATPAPLVPALVGLSAIFVMELLVYFSSWVWRSAKHATLHSAQHVMRMVVTPDDPMYTAIRLTLVVVALATIVGVVGDLIQPLVILIDIIALSFYLACRGVSIILPNTEALVEWDFRTILLAVGPALTVRLYCFLQCSDTAEDHTDKSLDPHELERSCPVSQDVDRSASATGMVPDEYSDGSNCRLAWPWLTFFLMVSHYALSMQVICPATYEWAMKTMVMSISATYALRFTIYIGLLIVHGIWRAAKFLKANIRTMVICSVVAFIQHSLCRTDEPNSLRPLNLMELLQTFLPLLPIVEDARFATWHYIMDLDQASKIVIFGSPLVFQFYKLLADWRRVCCERTLDVMEGEGDCS